MHKACKKGAHKNKKYATPKVCNAATQRNTKLCNVATPKVKTIAYKHERPRSHLQEGVAPHVRGSVIGRAYRRLEIVPPPATLKNFF